MPKTQKRCINCGLPETYPGIKFNEEVVCNYCDYFALNKTREKLMRNAYREGVRNFIRREKKKNSIYDGVVAYSGGKDSTFLLYFLKNNLGLNVLAHTFDNNFLSPTALQNIKSITNNLKVVSKVTKPNPSLLHSVFHYALTQKIPYPQEIRAIMSQVCAVCIGMVIGSTIRLAQRMKIPIIFFGFTPGQYPAISLENFFKVESCLFFSDRVYKDDPLDVLKIISDPIYARFGNKIDKYFFRSHYHRKSRFIPKVFFPFHMLIDYDENVILQKIEKLGWIKPNDTDSCSTNCLLNRLGNITFAKQNLYHPYAAEVSYLVRDKKMSYEQALLATANDMPQKTRVIADRLGLP